MELGTSPKTTEASSDQITFITTGSLYYRIAGGTNNLRLTEEIYSELKKNSGNKATTTWRDVLKEMFQFYKISSTGAPTIIQEQNDQKETVSYPELFEARGVKETGLGRGDTDKQYTFIRRGGEVYFYREGSENSYYNVSNTHRNFGGFKQEYLPSGSQYYLQGDKDNDFQVQGVKEETYSINYHVTKIGDYYFPVELQSSALGPFYRLIEIADTDTRKFLTIYYDNTDTKIKYKSIECNNKEEFTYISDEGFLLEEYGSLLDIESVDGVQAEWADSASDLSADEQNGRPEFTKDAAQGWLLDNKSNAVTDIDGYKFKIDSDNNIIVSEVQELIPGSNVDSTDDSNKHFGLFKDYRLIEEDKDLEIWYKSGSVSSDLDDNNAAGLIVSQDITDYLTEDNHLSGDNTDIAGGSQYLPRIDYILSRRRSDKDDFSRQFFNRWRVRISTRLCAHNCT